jgi:hypothetical protein
MSSTFELVQGVFAFDSSRVSKPISNNNSSKQIQPLNRSVVVNKKDLSLVQVGGNDVV